VRPELKNGADASFFQSPLAPKTSGPSSVEPSAAIMVGVGAAAGMGVASRTACGGCNLWCRFLKILSAKDGARYRHLAQRTYDGVAERDCDRGG
jgi:hypothetical protein